MGTDRPVSASESAQAGVEECSRTDSVRGEDMFRPVNLVPSVSLSAGGRGPRYRREL